MCVTQQLHAHSTQHSYIMASHTAASPPATSASGGGSVATIEPKTRQEKRQQCYDARDAFYACLDGVKAANAKSSDGKAATSAKVACAALASEYKANCMRSWVHTRHTDSVVVTVLFVSCTCCGTCCVCVCNNRGGTLMIVGSEGGR